MAKNGKKFKMLYVYHVNECQEKALLTLGY